LFLNICHSHSHALRVICKRALDEKARERMRRRGALGSAQRDLIRITTEVKLKVGNDVTVCDQRRIRFPKCDPFKPALSPMPPALKRVLRRQYRSCTFSFSCTA
jgi:hypothetical protein